jgi:hypothetical protein
VTKSPATPDHPLARLSAICLALPGAEREDMGVHAAFRTGKKVFVYYLDNHHGDGILGFACKLPPGENTALIAARPDRFYLPACVGPRGWVGFRLDRGRIAWTEVAELVRVSYTLIAPKRLLRELDLTESGGKKR